LLWELQTNVLGEALFEGYYSENITAQTWFTANWNKTQYNFVCTTNIVYDTENFTTNATSLYSIFASQQDLNNVNTTDNNTAIFGESI
jgi:hypothetical protein